MQKNKQNKNRKGQERLFQWNRNLLPLQVILAVLPLILYVKIGYSGFSEYPWNAKEDIYLDVFLHGKMVVFLLVALAMLSLVIYKLRHMDNQLRKAALRRFIPLFVYVGGVLLSALCSKNLSYSFLGSMDAKEPVTVLLGYVITVFYAYLVVDSAEDISRLTGAAVMGSTGMAVIGVLQAVGKNPLLHEKVQRLYAGNSFVDTYGLLQPAFPSGMVYGTLFNPNYVGTYVAVYAPLLLFGIVMFQALWKKAVCVISLLGLFLMLFGSQSRTGLISVLAVAAVILIFWGRKIFKYWYMVIPGITALVFAFLLVDTGKGGLLTTRLKELLVIRPSEDPVQGVDTTGNGVRVWYKDTEFKVMMPVLENSFSYEAFEGEDQKQITYNEDSSYGYFTLNNGDEIAIQTAVYEEKYAFGLKINNRDFYFTNQLVPGDYKYINELGRLDECIIPANVFPGYETVGSGRGYVWGRSIPLLLNNLVIGSGPDTFALEFPQNDYVARYRCGFDNTIFTRPHNFYLQMGLQTGVLSLMAFLVFYGTYFVGSCRRYFGREVLSTEEWIGFALFLSTLGFMAAGLANDSLIVVTPVFYVLLGTGMAVNQKLCSRHTKEKNKVKEG